MLVAGGRGGGGGERGSVKWRLKLEDNAQTLEEIKRNLTLMNRSSSECYC